MNRPLEMGLVHTTKAIRSLGETKRCTSAPRPKHAPWSSSWGSRVRKEAAHPAVTRNPNPSSSPPRRGMVAAPRTTAAARARRHHLMAARFSAAVSSGSRNRTAEGGRSARGSWSAPV